MKRRKIMPTGGIKANPSVRGENIEIKVARMIDNEEPIKDSVPMIYTEMKDGVRPEYDIRTDRFMIAMNAMDKISSYKISEYLKEGTATTKEDEQKPEQKPEEKKED